VDVSHWNGAPNFQALRGHGMQFVFAKASQGTWLQDDMFVRNTQEARAAGLLPGAYHFFDYNKGGRQQAKHFLATVQNTVGLGGLLPLVVDVETLKSLGTPNQPLARARLHALLDELYRQTGRYPMIYTSREMWQRVVGAPDDFGPYRLWVACWKCDQVHLPKGWSDWDFWQVGLFRFPDIPSLDGNTFRSSQNKLRRQLQRDMRLNKGADWSASTTAQADLSGYDGTEVRVALEDGSFGAWEPYQHPFPVQMGGKQGPRTIQLQLRSYRGVASPVITDAIQLDSVPPKVKGPWIGMSAGGQVARDGDRIPLSATIQAKDATSGLASTRIESQCGSRRASRTRQAPDVDLQVAVDRSGCTLTGVGTDNLGHTASSSIDPRIKLVDVRERSRDLSFKGDWKTVRMKSALGRTLTQSSAPGARARIRFEGAQYAIVARRGPSGGVLEVLVDGKPVTTVDLFAKKSDGRRVVHVGSVKRGKHVLELRAAGTARAKSSGTTIWLDGILVLDRQK
jgi:lysozyme